MLDAKIDDVRSVVVNGALVALRGRSSLSSSWYDVIMPGPAMGFVFRFLRMGMFARTTYRLRPTVFRCAWVAIVASGILAAPGAASASSTDIVVMRNGDRLVGEVKDLRQGTLEFKTDTMGTVSIKWDWVEQLTAPRYFEVENSDGLKFYGTIQPGAAGKLGVLLDGHLTELELKSVVKLRPLSQSFWTRLDGSISIGANYTLASGIGQGSLNANVASRREKFEWSTKLSTTITIQEDQPRSSRTTSSFGYSRFLKNRWFVPIIGQVDRNPDLGYNLRASAGSGIGRTLVQTNRSALAVLTMIRVDQEVPVSGETTSNTEAVFGSSYSYFTHDTPKTNVALSCYVSPSLTVAHRYRVDTDVSLSREIVKNFTAGMTFYDAYDSRPPSEGSLKNDFGFTLNVGWTF